MAVTAISGPSIVSGNIDPATNRVPDQGPSLTFQGSGVLDPRFVGNLGAALGTKPVYGFYANPYFALVDAVPQAASATRIAAAANVVSGTNMTLVSAQGVGVSPNIPVVPYGASYTPTNAVKALALDFGFTTGNTTATSKNVTIPAGAWKYFQAGESLAISGAGATVNTPLLTTVAVTPLPNATTLVINDAAGQTVANAQIGNMDNSLSGAWPYVTAGAIALADPAQSLCRGVSITGSASGSGGNFTVSGYDLFGQPMSETITATAGATTVYGKKAFKYITSVKPLFTNAFNYSVGTSDMFGFPVRADLWEYMQVFMAGAFLTVNTGWTAADATNPATATTGDVRGTLQIGALGSLGSGSAGGPTDGSKRFAAFMSMPVYNAVGATNLAFSTMFGSTQA